MGNSAGFDMVPRLSKAAVERHNWTQFIDRVKKRYETDPQVEVKPNYIEFKAGDNPKLPFEGHKFLRFSSEVSGTAAEVTRVQGYIEIITILAYCSFGSRAQSWNECVNQWGQDQREDGANHCGQYDEDEVKESIRSYEQPDELEIPISFGHFMNGFDPLQELNIPLFEVKEIPGKGKGLVARFNISKGTRILCEKPLLIVSPKPREELEQFLAAKLKAMSKTSQRQFLSLHNKAPGKYPFSGIVKTNALPCGPGSPIGGIYPTLCLINHSCVSNAHNNWNPTEKHETIHAIRPIKSGEEITIPYDRGGSSSERQTSLKNSFGFTCTCSTCSLSPASLQASDNRRMQIQSLDEAIGDPYRMMNKPHDSLRNCYTLLQVLEQEYNGCAGALVARVYYDAFQISVVHGDQARASVFAERGYKARVICEGEDSPETLKMKSLARKPSDHSSFAAYFMKSKTTREMFPKGLDVEQFEKWLFRLVN